jgi:hypothetical protein
MERDPLVPIEQDLANGREQVFHTLKSPIKRGDAIRRSKPRKNGNDQVVYVLVFSLQRVEED